MLINAKNIHFIGIGGIGMSGIAELLHNQKFNITGSDLTQSTNVDRLQKLNIEIADQSDLSTPEVLYCHQGR